MPPSHPPKAPSPEQIASLQQSAADAAQNAYAPYSNFRVGAAVLLTNNAVVTGCNVENASYRLTVCAEQAAIASAVALHGPAVRILAIAVANLNATASPPCGACRQTILEFSSPETLVFFPADANSTTQTTMAQLLPAAFLLPNP
jgi:cytidine deaminase